MTCLRRLLLAFLLVLGQLGAAAHTISHLSHRHPDGSTQGETLCKQCLSYSHFGAAAPASMPAAFAPSTPAAPLVAPAPASVDLVFCRAYLSRAPPRLSSNLL